MREDIKIIIYQLPPNIKACTVEVDGYYTIIVNDNLSPQVRFTEYLHELNHINNGDFSKDETADKIETLAHFTEGRHE